MDRPFDLVGMCADDLLQQIVIYHTVHHGYIILLDSSRLDWHISCNYIVNSSLFNLLMFSIVGLNNTMH